MIPRRAAALLRLALVAGLVLAPAGAARAQTGSDGSAAERLSRGVALSSTAVSISQASERVGVWVGGRRDQPRTLHSGLWGLPALGTFLSAWMLCAALGRARDAGRPPLARAGGRAARAPPAPAL